MLVVPALLSLKPQVMEKGCPEVIEVLSKTIKKLKDPQEIVSKTARKLIIELQKCYSSSFESHLIPLLKTEEERSLCKTILRNDDEEI